MKGFSTEEISRHRSKDSLWVVRGSRVYDVTDFARRHPGGAEVLQTHAGGDIAGVMSSAQPHKHSAAAYQILDKYRIGDLVQDDSSSTDNKVQLYFFSILI